MIDAGINAIVDLARKAGSQVLECKQEPEGTYYVRQGNGELVKTRADVAPRRHVVHDIETIVQLANRFKDTASVWHNFEGVTVLVDDNARNESARLALKPSKQFETLAKFDGDGWKNHALTQQELILLLRTTFAKSGPSAGLLAVVRKLRFRSAVESSAEIKHTRASVGKQVEQQVTGDADLPETTIFDIPVYESGFNVLFKIEVAIDLNLAGERFHLIPLPGQIAAAREHATDAMNRFLLQEIGKDGAVHDRIYRGQP